MNLTTMNTPIMEAEITRIFKNMIYGLNKKPLVRWLEVMNKFLRLAIDNIKFFPVNYCQTKKNDTPRKKVQRYCEGNI